MVVTITSRPTKTEIEAALKKLHEVNRQPFVDKNKAFNAHKYCGIIKLKEDPLELQKKWRNEWN